MTARRKKWRIALGCLVALVAATLILAWPLLVVAFAGSGLDPRIPPELRIAPSTNDALAEHTRLFERKVYKLGRRVYVAVGWGIANIIMIEGDDGLVIVDTGENLEQARQVLAELRKVTRKPVAGVVLTHHHADHVLGTAAFVDGKETAGRDVPIFAHESLVALYAGENGMLAELQMARSMHMYGAALGPADRARSNAGIGPFLARGTPGFVPPTRTFGDRLSATVAGVRMELRWVPSEAESEVAVWLPDDAILLSAEVVQDHGFPNLYTIRGARFRDPVRWVKSIDLLRTFPAQAMALQHGPPVVGSDEVARVLTLYRDAIEYVHDQTVRLMNKGLTPDELAQAVTLPRALAGDGPWARQYYGTVQNAVRGIYQGYVGWFDGDPIAFSRLPPVEHARRMTALMGGRDPVLAAARRAFADGDDGFAAELATLLVRIDRDDMTARHLKAAALRRMAYAEMNAPYRNYYLVSAMELDGQVWEPLYLRLAAAPLGAAMKDLPAEQQIALLPTRLVAEQTLDQDIVALVRYRGGAQFALHLRHGVLEVGTTPVRAPAFTLTVTRAAMGALLTGASLDDELASGAIGLDGDGAVARRFFGWLERPFVMKPEVVVR